MSDIPQLQIYNTLTRKKEVFEPIETDNVRLYVCGPTVYDFAHIGNARPVIVFDVLYRLLRHIYGEDHVTYVRNITDVDDKINARALRDFPDLPLNEAIAKVTENTASQFHADVKVLGCLEPDHEPRATQHIEGMVKMIQTLIDKGHAYQAGGEVLFDVSSMANYGQLSNRKLEDQKAGARIATTGHKKNPGDFVLWKLSDKNQPGWESPWGTGRPGWHIECSVMSAYHLGKTFDIHGGGLDLIFPHHENEIAQSCCAHNTDKMARYWMHNGFLQVEGKKMSKSDGNFVTIQDLLETEKFGGRKWPGEVLRLAMLMTHYREPIDFSVRRLEEAQARLVEWSGITQEYRGKIPHQLSEEFLDAVADDLNMPKAISILLKHWKDLRSTKLQPDATQLALSHFLGALEFIAIDPVAVGNIVKVASPMSEELRLKLQVLLEQRVEARAMKDWALADKIRGQIENLGFSIKDVKDDTGNVVPRLEPLS